MKTSGFHLLFKCIEMNGFLGFPLLFFSPLILYCFPLNKVEAISPPEPEGLCLERIGNGTYLNM
ncbi:hypothetical protein, partial [Burkholderia sp. GbtcB21]